MAFAMFMGFFSSTYTALLNPILARLLELHRWPGEGRFALPSKQANFHHMTIFW